MSAAALLDRFGRVHTNLRVSVTDRCNIRCFYCMPAGDVQFQPREELLTFEEITQFVEAATTLGIVSVRLTGGEPLVRADLSALVRMISGISGIQDLALTTNGMLLAEQAPDLRAAGLERLNISLDTMDPDVFRSITRRDGFDSVIKGIDAAIQAGFPKIRINAIAIRNVTEPEIGRLVEFTALRGVELRFIEFMPLDADKAWSTESVLTGEMIRERIEADFGPLDPAPRNNPSQPAVDFVIRKSGARVGFINPVSKPFCGDCNRLRLTAEGKLRNCLFSTEEWDARALLRGGATEPAVQQLIRDCVANKRAGHGIDEPDFLPPARAMFQIGG